MYGEPRNRSIWVLGMTLRVLIDFERAFAHIDQSCSAFYGGSKLTGRFNILYIVKTINWSLTPPQARINTSSS
jgi:hypothetical protein